jgi:hypothetical protein
MTPANPPKAVNDGASPEDSPHGVYRLEPDKQPHTELPIINRVFSQDKKSTSQLARNGQTTHKSQIHT